MADEVNNIYVNLPPEANLQLPDPGLLAYYRDLGCRVYWLTGEINQDNYDLIQYIFRVNREDKDIPVEKRTPIKIMFNSPGGELDVADAIVSVIELSQTPIYGYGIGLIGSAASQIFLSCHKRFALKTAYWILHKGSAVMSGDYNSIANAMDDYHRQIEHLVKFYIEKTTYPSEIINDKIKSDWYIHTDEALKYNVIEQIIDDINVVF